MGRRISLIFALAVSITLVRSAPAITIPLVRIGNPGNARDTVPFSNGKVDYIYNIGKTEVTIGQYTAFLNAVAAADPYALYNPLMASDLQIAGIARSGSSGSYTYSVIGSANHPVTFVGVGDAFRFSNWLNNGQRTGAEDASTTEQGAYTLNGVTTEPALDAITRNTGATWFLPNNSEWYKAAYYDPTVGHYWQYPTGTNTSPTSAPPGGTPNTANFRADGSLAYAVTGSSTLDQSQNYLTDVGAYTASASPYGTFDQGGNAVEWTEGLIDIYAVFRGGAWSDLSVDSSSARVYLGIIRSDEAGFGFRVAAAASVPVPEPDTAILAALGAAGLAARGWGRRKRFSLL